MCLHDEAPIGECAVCTYGQSSSVMLGDVWGPPGALDSDFYYSQRSLAVYGLRHAGTFCLQHFDRPNLRCLSQRQLKRRICMFQH